MMRKYILFSVLLTSIACLLSLWPTTSSAQSSTGHDLWVDRDSLGGTCSDARPRTDVTQQTPWCTLGRAGEFAQPGDVVHVRRGTYSELYSCDACDDESVLQVVVAGRADAWIRFVAEPGEQVRITGDGGAQYGIFIRETHTGVVPSYIHMEGFEVSDFSVNCVTVRSTSDVVIRGLDVTRCRSGAMEVLEAQRVTVEYNKVHDNGLAGYTSAVDLWRCGPGNVVRGNLIWNNTDEEANESEGHGIIMDTCLEDGSLLIENNVIWNNEGWCIAIYRSDNSVLRNNTCWQNGGNRPSTGEVAVLGRNHKVYNNIFIPRAGQLALHLREKNPDYVGHLHTLDEDGNILWAPAQERVVAWSFGTVRSVAEYQQQNPQGWGQNTRQVDPQFVNPGGGDFRLSSSSPAVDSAVDALASSVDVMALTRPQDGNGDGGVQADRGAYERAGSSAATEMPTALPATLIPTLIPTLTPTLIPTGLSPTSVPTLTPMAGTPTRESTVVATGVAPTADAPISTDEPATTATSAPAFTPTSTEGNTPAPTALATVQPGITQTPTSAPTELATANATIPPTPTAETTPDPASPPITEHPADQPMRLYLPLVNRE